MEIFHWYKVTLEFLKGNKVFLLIVTSLLSGNIYQAVSPTVQKDVVKAEPKVIIEKTCDCKYLEEDINQLKRWHE